MELHLRKFFLIRLIVFFSYMVITADTSSCVKIDACRCSTHSRTIDLSSLNGDGSTPRFSISDSSPTRPYKYLYNPCKAFTIPFTSCQGPDVTLFQQQTSSPICYPLGKLSTLQFKGDPDTDSLQIVYTHAGVLPTQIRTATVSVLCTAGDPSFQFIEEKPSIHYKFKLFTNLVCPTKSRLSIGSILVIIFFVCVIIYFVGGILFLKFVRKAQGFEMIPNTSFWKEIPLLIRDGMFFVFRGCKVQTQYEKI